MENKNNEEIKERRKLKTEEKRGKVVEYEENDLSMTTCERTRLRKKKRKETMEEWKKKNKK